MKLNIDSQFISSLGDTMLLNRKRLLSLRGRSPTPSESPQQKQFWIACVRAWICPVGICRKVPSRVNSRKIFLRYDLKSLILRDPRRWRVPKVWGGSGWCATAASRPTRRTRSRPTCSVTSRNRGNRPGVCNCRNNSGTNNYIVLLLNWRAP